MRTRNVVSRSNNHVLALLLILAGCAQEKQPLQSSDNLMFRGDGRHTGVSIAAPFKSVTVKWKFETKGAIRGTASIAGENLFFGSADNFLYAVDKVTGKENWRFETGGPVSSTPAISGDVVVFSSRDLFVYGIGRETGKHIWKFQIAEAPAAHKWGWDYFVSSPTIADNHVFIGTGEGLVLSLDLNTGKENWRFKTGGRVRATPAVSEGVVYVGSFDSYFYALNAADGKLIWKFETDGKKFNSDSSGWDRNSIDASASITDTALVFGSRDGNVYALNKQNGGLYWKFSTGPTWSLSSPAIAGNTVYVGWSDNFLFNALDLATGREKWQHTCRHYVYSSPLVTDTIVYVGSHDRNFYAFDTRTGKKIWQYRTDGIVMSSPITDGNLLFIGSDDGNLYAFERTAKPQPRKAVYFATVPPKYYPQDPRLGPYLVSYGYQPLDTASLEIFLRERIADRTNSVIVFGTDRIPNHLIAPASGTGLVRQYLESGGRVVWIGTVPNLYKYSAAGHVMGEDASAAEKLLSMKFDATHDWGSYYSRATDAGRKSSLPEWWVGSFSVPAQDGIVPLAMNDLNRPSSWLKTFNDGPGKGFFQLRPWDVGRSARDHELEMVRRLSEEGL